MVSSGNRGVGSWEINTAAFLSAVNGNAWWYFYQPDEHDGRDTRRPLGRPARYTGTLNDAFLDAAGKTSFAIPV